MTRRAASGGRTDEAADPPVAADPEAEAATGAAADAATTSAETPHDEDGPAGAEPEPADGTEPSAAEAADPAASEPSPEATGAPADEPDADEPEAEAPEPDEPEPDEPEAEAPEAEEPEAEEPEAEAPEPEAPEPEAPEPEEPEAEAPEVEAAAAPGGDAEPPPEPEPVDREPVLVGSLRRVRAELAGIRFPLTLPDAGTAAESARALATQLDDYLLPRLTKLDAPLLVVVGGSTGAGKSTLVNSLVRAPVSPAGVLRPTTRAPVLVSAPGDARWFLGSADSDLYLLPHLTRTTGLHAEPGALRVISAPGLPRGLALLDAPDLDSVVAANRALADEVHRAADLWLCVTTAARYADAVPWAALRAARDRGTRLALLLNRVPPGAEDEIVAHFGELLEAEGLAGTTLFVLPEVVLDGQGLLSEDQAAPIATYLADLAGDPETRVRVVGDTLGGALAALRWGVEELAEAVERQHAAATALRETVRRVYARALASVEAALADGTLLRGEVLARWRQFVDEGGIRAAVGAKGFAQRIRAAFGAPEPPVGRLLAALEAALVTLVAEVLTEADDQARAAWTADPAGAALLTRAPRHGTHGRVAAGAVRTDRVRALVRDWLSGIREAAASEPVALLVVLRVLAGELPLDPREQTRVRGVLGQLGVRTLVETSRADLLARVDALLNADAAAFTTLLADADDAAATAQRLRAAVSTGAAA